MHNLYYRFSEGIDTNVILASAQSGQDENGANIWTAIDINNNGDTFVVRDNDNNGL